MPIFIDPIYLLGIFPLQDLSSCQVQLPEIALFYSLIFLNYENSKSIQKSDLNNQNPNRKVSASVSKVWARLILSDSGFSRGINPRSINYKRKYLNSRKYIRLK